MILKTVRIALILIGAGSTEVSSAAGPELENCIGQVLDIALVASRQLDEEQLQSITIDTQCSQQASPWQVHYARGYIFYRLGEVRLSSDDAGADDGFLDAINQLDTAIDLKPDCAKCHALLSSAYGMRIGLHPIRGISLGSKVDRQMDAAIGLAASHPVVLLLRANRRLYTPGMFGGDMATAAKLFERAIEQFRLCPPEPGWNVAEVHYHAAILANREEDSKTASRHLKAALAQDPGFVVARKLLDQI